MSSNGTVSASTRGLCYTRDKNFEPHWRVWTRGVVLYTRFYGKSAIPTLAFWCHVEILESLLFEGFFFVLTCQRQKKSVLEKHCFWWQRIKWILRGDFWTACEETWRKGTEKQMCAVDGFSCTLKKRSQISHFCDWLIKNPLFLWS